MFLESIELGVFYHPDSVHDLVDRVFPFERAETGAQQCAVEAGKPALNPLTLFVHNLSSQIYT